jgi:hypothetical protein
LDISLYLSGANAPLDHEIGRKSTPSTRKAVGCRPDRSNRLAIAAQIVEEII